MTTKTQEQRAEEFRIGVHEFGHYLVCLNYKIPCDIQIFSIDGGEWNDTDGTPSAGVCSREFKGTPFQRSVVGWGGIMAELIVGVQLPKCNIGFPLTVENLVYCHSSFLVKSFYELSLSDQLAICGNKPKQTWRSFKAAYRILSAKKSELLRLATERTGVALDAVKASPAPMPEKFPAALAEFLALIIGGTDPQEKFRAFIHAQTEKFFADSQLRFATPEQRLAGMESWTAARMAKYQAGFPGPDEWIGMARAYRAWTKTAPANKSTDHSHENT